MRRAVRELVIFGVGPVVLVLACTLGVLGGLARTEAWVPVYAIGLIIGLLALGGYGVAVIFRAIRWLATGAR